MFNFQRKTVLIKLPSGINCTVGALYAGHQGLLTKKGGKASDKMNELIADLVIDIDGMEWAGLSVAKRKEAVRQMLSGDRKTILTQARQLTMEYPREFEFHHEHKTAAGVKKSELFKVILINEDNRSEIIETISKAYPNSDPELLQQLNIVGGFPTRPYAKQFDGYPIDTVEIEPILTGIIDGYELTFRMLTGQLEEGFNAESDSNTRVFARKLRTRKTGETNWQAVPIELIKTMPLPIIEKIISAISQHEGDVDTVEIRENSEGEKMVVELTGELSFFFPSGKI